MASTKAGGSAKNLTDSNAQYLGVKLADGQAARPGMIIVRQRGTKVEAGRNVKVGKDHTLFALAEGKLFFAISAFAALTVKIVSKKFVEVL
jgi:large subunit ribosomal protein L27